MIRRVFLLTITALFFWASTAKSQEPTPDTVQQHLNASTSNVTMQQEIKVKVPKSRRPHNPRTATIMSACLPGLGQVYNGKWWKVPIVYAGLGGLGYMAYDNRHQYNCYLEAYKYSTDPSSVPDPTEYTLTLTQKYGAQQLQTYKEKYRHDFELFTILTVAWYAVNIVDACVDGHLYTYDISDDLSLSVQPMPTNPTGTLFPAPLSALAGISFNLSFDK